MKSIENRIRSQIDNGTGIITLTYYEAEELLEYFNDVVDLKDQLREANNIIFDMYKILQKETES